MEKLISALEDLRTDLRNMQEHLRGVTWPSRSLALMANDLIISLGMSASTVETLRGLLAGLEEAKAEVKEAIEEEESGEDLSEQVSGEEVHEERPPEVTRKPEARGSKGSKHVRKRKR